MIGLVDTKDNGVSGGKFLKIITQGAELGGATGSIIAGVKDQQDIFSAAPILEVKHFISLIR